jgi:hypothetical protein
VLVNPDDHSRPRVAAVRHVLFLPRFGIAGQEDASRTIGEEDGNRVVVGLGKKLASRRRDDVQKSADVVGIRVADQCASEGTASNALAVATIRIMERR